MRNLGLAILLAAAVLAGCSYLEPTYVGGPYPEACASMHLEERRCAAIVARARGSLSIASEEITAIDLLPPPKSGPTLGGGPMVIVRFTLVGGRTEEQPVGCPTISRESDRACSDDPHLTIHGGIDRDVPCTGEPPDGCATKPPSPRPEAVAAARPLRVPSLSIPLDHVGAYEVEVGRAGLPDGVLTERSAALADPRPTTFWIEDGIRIEVRPEVEGRPAIGSIYRDPFDGVEPVRVVLLFEVTERQPGAVLEVRDLIVR